MHITLPPLRGLAEVLYYGMNWPFDTVIVDELSSFRNPSSQRFKALRKVRPLVKYLWGLTGTPRPRRGPRHTRPRPRSATASH